VKAECSDGRVKIKTSREGIEINSRDIIHFPDGLIGFEEYTDFIIFDLKDCSPFKSMLSVREGGPDFVVFEPLGIFKDYALHVTGASLAYPDLGNPGDQALLSIVTLAERPEEITVNLRGPIFLNYKTRRARQVIVSDDRFQTREPLFPYG